MKARNKARRIWKRRRTETNYTRFKRLRNQVQTIIRTKEKYYLNAFQNVSEPTTTWKKFRHLGLQNKKNSINT